MPQRLAWPSVAAGSNCLVLAPTGSGKTLAACLPLLSRLAESPLASGTRCLYVAPLKALCNDVRRNLTRCVEGLAQYSEGGASALRVAARSGDTTAARRRRLFAEPPGVLVTTPESLAVLLTQGDGRDLLANVRHVVVDEVHALAGNKRGADLSLALERLEEHAGRAIQRVGLSATCRPADAVARFLVGVGRDCVIARAGEPTGLELRIEPLGFAGDGERRPFFEHLLGRLWPEIEANRTTLVFANTRGLAERLGWAIRNHFPELAEIVGVHHSSLARRRRREVERQLKRGELRVVVSSASLELGIDVGAVDGVVLVHPPGGVARLLQRLGRAGHGPGRPRRGLLLVSNPTELLEGTVTAGAGHLGQLEATSVPDSPLDILCQHLLGMAAQRPWGPDEAFAVVRRAYPYRDLGRDDFTACLDYLSGRDPHGRAWLPPRLRWYDGNFTLLDGRSLRALQRNIGTILGEDRLRVKRTDGAVVGEVDQAFGERLQPGDRFLLDGRCLEYRRLLKGALRVEEVVGRPVTPRWLSDGWAISPELAGRIVAFRRLAAETLPHGTPALERLLRADYGLSAAAAALLASFFARQEALSEIPDGSALLVEAVASSTGAEYYLHTPLNRAGNDALGRVAALRLRRAGCDAQAPLAADLGLVVSLTGGDPPGPEEWRRLLAADNFAADLAEVMHDCALVRDRFRRVATTALMLLKNPLGKKHRVGGRDWAERRLFDQVRTRQPDFVLLRQAGREVLSGAVDAEAARHYAEGLANQVVRIRWLPAPSPFAEHWTQEVTSAEELVGDPLTALERLHAALTGGAGQGGTGHEG